MATAIPGPAAGAERRLDLVEQLTFEVVPLKSLDGAVAALPPRSTVSVTCSPVKGIDETVHLTNAIRQAGHTAIPHIAARLVEGPEHVAAIAHWLRVEGIGQMFLVGGDANPAVGPYQDAASFLRDLLEAGPELHTVGVTSYPDGHATIPDHILSAALHHKQAMLAEAGIAGYASTQMCFDPTRLSSWLRAERNNGLTMPIHLGLAGVVDRTKLMTMGVRLGIGASLGYLKKNRRAIGRLLTATDYNPDSLLMPLQAELDALGIEAIHCFTFNQVAATEAWRRDVLTVGGR